MEKFLVGEFPFLEVRCLVKSGKLEKIEITKSKSGFYCLFLEEICPHFLNWMQCYAQKKPLPEVKIAFSPSFPPFYQKVLETLQKVPFGEVLSYKDLAQRVGSPRAARAVGSACHHNPFPLLIPCHRVIAASGKLTGFAFGLEIKKELLKFEK